MNSQSICCFFSSSPLRLALCSNAFFCCSADRAGMFRQSSDSSRERRSGSAMRCKDCLDGMVAKKGRSELRVYLVRYAKSAFSHSGMRQMACRLSTQSQVLSRLSRMQGLSDAALCSSINNAECMLLHTACTRCVFPLLSGPCTKHPCLAISWCLSVCIRERCAQSSA